jgi:hypothetical protein
MLWLRLALRWHLLRYTLLLLLLRRISWLRLTCGRRHEGNVYGSNLTIVLRVQVWMQRLEGQAKGEVAIPLIVRIDSITNLTTSVGTEATNREELVPINEEIVHLYCHLNDRLADLSPHIVLVELHLANLVQPIRGFSNDCQRSVVKQVANDL